MTAHSVDVTLLRDLKRFGAFDIGACFNCGNCTAVCQLSEEGAAFPRRLIRFGQLGMRDRLTSAKEVWLCWNCRECADTCPRQARPSEYVEAARRYTIAGLDPTGIARAMYGSTPFLVGFALFLAALFAGVLVGHAGVPAAGRLDLFGFIPFELIHDLGVAVMALVGLVAVVTTVRLVRQLSEAFGPGDVDGSAAGGGGGPVDRAIRATVALVNEMVSQRRFRTCEVPDLGPIPLRPWFVHYSLMWGFIGLGVATAFDFLFKTPGELVPIWYFSRLVGTVSGLFLMYGATVTLIRHARPAGSNLSRLLPSDWLFVGLLFVVGLTGFALELVVYMPQPPSVGYGFFLVHVVLAMELLVLFPFTKFAHALYRPLAYWLYIYRAAPAVGAAAMGEVE